MLSMTDTLIGFWGHAIWFRRRASFAACQAIQQVKSDNASVSQTINTGHTEAYGEKLMGSATGTLNGSVRTVFFSFSLLVALVWLIITFSIWLGRGAILDQENRPFNYVFS
jgi:hypothetical protein